MSSLRAPSGLSVVWKTGCEPARLALKPTQVPATAVTVLRTKQRRDISLLGRRPVTFPLFRNGLFIPSGLATHQLKFHAFLDQYVKCDFLQILLSQVLWLVVHSDEYSRACRTESSKRHGVPTIVPTILSQTLTTAGNAGVSWFLCLSAFSRR